VVAAPQCSSIHVRLSVGNLQYVLLGQPISAYLIDTRLQSAPITKSDTAKSDQKLAPSEPQ
jgi:hypothetical protein